MKSFVSFLKGSSLQKLAYPFATALVTSYVVLVFILNPGINAYYAAQVVDMIYGEAYRPFVYRLLLPGLVRWMAMLVPEGVQSFINQSANPVVIRAFGWEPTYLTEYLLLVTLMWLSLLGFLFALRYLFEGVFHAPAQVAPIIALIAVAGLPGFFKYRYLYDFSTLFLFTLGLGFMARLKWLPFLVLFSIACLNKETTILLTLIFVIHFGGRREKMSRAVFVRLLLYQLLVFVVIRLAIIYAFRNNPGGSFEFHLVDRNLDLLLRPYAFSTLLLGLGALLLVLYDWGHKPVFLKHGLVILVPLFLLTLFLGILDEIRVYYEVYPIVILLMAQTVCRLLGIPVRDKSLDTSPPTPAPPAPT